MSRRTGITKACYHIAESSWFQYFILAVILAAAALVGIETYPEITEKHYSLLHWLNQLMLYVFVAEAAVKMMQHGRYFYRYSLDPWNLFDFSIVVVCFLPVNASYAAVLRLARIMRAQRLMTALPQLQLIVGALIRSIPSMGYVGILLALNFYVYAVMGVFLFRENDPVHFCDLPRAMLTLFRVVTLEDWTDVMYINMWGSDNYDGYSEKWTAATGILPQPRAMPLISAAYFVSFVMFGTMIMLNLFIGVIINSMDEARTEREHEQRAEAEGKQPDIFSEIDEVARHVDELKESLDVLKMIADKERKKKV